MNPAQQVQKQLIAELPFGYFSHIRCQFVRAGGGPYTWTLSAGPRKAFQYGQGQNAAVAGFDAAYVASAADTNLQAPGQTLAAQTVEIGGLCFRITEDSDPWLAALVLRNSWVEISLDGQQSRQIGKVTDYPGAGGLKGRGRTRMLEPDLYTPGTDQGQGATFGTIQNGEPAAGNYRRWHKQPLVWFPVNAQEKDNNLSVSLMLQQSIVWNTADRVAIADVATIVGNTAFTAPAATPGTIGSYVDFEVMLVTRTKGPTSANW